MRARPFLLLAALLTPVAVTTAQPRTKETDAEKSIRAIYTEALVHGQAYENLRARTISIQPRQTLRCSPLYDLGATVSEIATDSQRYFEIHQTRDDSFDKINARELHLGAAAMAALVCLVDSQGL